ncbi:hypothetical protein I2I05_19020 [Hymenobacter sp. BT683]|uniref:Uncharacterized protein n=1 Tax=Hymenobacter jeongseonensis TaxID=2791027 RepID=A0ABS0IM89_9BACT|nr:hypothetical protein [Hymenobacter jeongseonensis]MBF9239493.1 hypothetical protein [Hymenobacter jeongseonensis]
MHLNTDALADPAPRKKPCIRDMHELVTHHLPSAVVKLIPLDELDRRGEELMAEHPRFVEELPILVQGEKVRRARFRSLQLVGRMPAPMTTTQAYLNA